MRRTFFTRLAALAAVFAVAAAVAGPALAFPSSGGAGVRLGTVFHDPQGNSAILTGKPGAGTPTTSATPNSLPSSCTPAGYVCAYEGVNYNSGGSDWSYAFPSRYSPYTSLQGGCYSINSGYSFNDCAQSVYNNYGSCSYAQWWWNAGYGGNSFKNNDHSGDEYLGNIGQGDQFSSQINCN